MDDNSTDNSSANSTADLDAALATLRESMPSLQAAAQSMQATLDDVLSLEQIEAGAMRLQVRPARIGPAFLQSVAQRLRTQAVHAGVQIRWADLRDHVGADASEAAEVPVLVDKGRLQGAMMTIASNALHWSIGDEDGSESGRKARPAVTLGCSSAPPHLWTGEDWAQAARELGAHTAGRLLQIVTHTRVRAVEDEGYGNTRGNPLETSRDAATARRVRATSIASAQSKHS